MIKIILEGLKLAPRFLWQLYIQPAKINDFLKADRKNIYTSTWAFFFSGLLAGKILALPHYFFYHDSLQCIRFIFMVAFIFSFAFAVASASATAFSFIFAGAIAIIIAFVGAFAGAGALAGAGTGAFAGIIAVISAFTGAAAGAVIVTILIAFAIAFVFLENFPVTRLDNLTIIKIVFQPYGKLILIILFLIPIVFFYLRFKKKQKTNEGIVPAIFPSAFAFLFLMVTPSRDLAPTSSEVVLFPFSFLIAYLFHFLLFDEFLSIKSAKAYKDNIEYHQRYRKIQKSSLFWGPIICIIVYLLPYWRERIKFDTPVHIIAIGFVVISLFILHAPDYLICLPLWARQRRQIMRYNDNKKETLLSYENSIIFKHERLFFQLPGVYKVMLHFAGNKEYSLSEIVKRIIYLHLFTFQQKQAEKAIQELAKNRQISHQLFLLIFELSGSPLIKTIVSNNRMAKLYYSLTEIEDNNKELIVFRIQRVCRLMSEEKGYSYNDEIIKTFKANRQLLLSENSQDII